jgi:hypothetical protein
MVKKGKSLKGEDVLQEEGSKPEFYTEEHEKLLGNTEKSWTLFVDGYGKDGRRIYDRVRGKTCHQCRSEWFSPLLYTCMTPPSFLDYKLGLVCRYLKIMRGKTLAHQMILVNWTRPKLGHVLNALKLSF